MMMMISDDDSDDNDDLMLVTIMLVVMVLLLMVILRLYKMTMTTIMTYIKIVITGVVWSAADFYTKTLFYKSNLICLTTSIRIR